MWLGVNGILNDENIEDLNNSNFKGALHKIIGNTRGTCWRSVLFWEIYQNK